MRKVGFASIAINLENDLPFSMSSESDKQVLLFPLSGDVEMDVNPLNNDNEFLYQNIKTKIQNGLELMILEEVVDVKVEQIIKVDLIKNEQMMFNVLNKNIDEKDNIDVEKKMVEEQSQDEQLPDSQSVYNPSTFDKRMNIPIGNGKKRGPYKKFSQQEKQVLVNQAKKFGINQIVRKKAIARKTLCRWISDGVVRKYGGGRQVGDLVMQQKLITIIQSHFNNKFQILPKPKIQQLAIKLSSNDLFTASHGWFQKFYMRHKKQFQKMLQELESKQNPKQKMQQENKK